MVRRKVTSTQEHHRPLEIPAIEPEAENERLVELNSGKFIIIAEQTKQIRATSHTLGQKTLETYETG